MGKKKVPPMETVEAQATLDKYLHELQQANARLEALQLNKCEEQLALSKKYDDDIMALDMQAKGIFDLVKKHCKAHRKAILPADAKSVTLTNGTVGWALGNWKLVIGRGKEPSVIEALKGHGRGDLIRTKEEIRKTQLLESDGRAWLLTNPIEGMRVDREERFYIDFGHKKDEEKKVVQS